jgi:hypothetical protein
MNKKITFVTILFLLVSVASFSATNKEKEDLYLKAVAEKDLNSKMGFLKEYVDKFGQKDDKFLRFIYQSLADTSYRLKNYEDAIKYGELTLGYLELDDNSKLNLLFTLSNAYQITKKDLDKALEYAISIVEMSDKIVQKLLASGQDKEKVDTMVNNYKTNLIAPAYKLQSLILYNKDKENVANIKQAVEKAIKAYEIDKAEATATMAFALAVNLSQKNQVNDALAAAEKVYNTEKPKYNETMFLASMYNKLNEKNKAVKYLEIAYKLKPQLDLAKNIAILVQKTDPEKGAQYFADAFVLSNLNKESDIYKYLQHIYFNIIAKDKSPEEKEAGFQLIIEAAKSRVGPQSN